jgi:hypothetical protein
MTDLKARLADALEEQFLHGAPSAEAVVNFIMSLPGIALVDRSELDQLLAVARLYVNAFAEDELMTLPERLRLQLIEDIVAAADAAEASND